MNKTLLLAAMTLAALCHAANSNASDRFGTVTVHNPLPITLGFHYRIGDQPWQTVEIPAGTGRSFHYQYPHANENRSPNFRIRFDQDLGPGTFWSEGNLQRHAVPDRSCQGKIYHFRYDGPARQFIDLNAIN